MSTQAAAPWYADGLRFTCTQCGNCCTGEPGLIYLSDAEADRLAAELAMDPQAFRRRYTITVHGENGSRLSLRDRPDAAHGHACVFWKTGVGCSVYAHRPTQCRTWPFWKRIVASRAAWNREAKQCPGMNHGHTHSAAHIAATASADGLPQ